MKIGLYFGSFNPIHIGHLIIANYVLNTTNLQQIWFVVSPQNPLKQAANLLNEYQRLHLVQLAIEGEVHLKASNIEFQLPKPSYTIDTLTYLQEKYPQHQFAVIMGSDSLQNIKKWKNYQILLSNYTFYIYNRPGFETNTELQKNIHNLSAPLLQISSTMIRQLIKEKKSIKYLTTDAVKKEIEDNNYYK
jgi:nicotinate-nucleotide adenylyltransferase